MKVLFITEITLNIKNILIYKIISNLIINIIINYLIFNFLYIIKELTTKYETRSMFGTI